MKALDIALKDLLRYSRSAFSLVMMFVAPLLITGLIYLAFGGGSSGEISINQINVALVNQDTPPPGIESALGEDLAGILSSDPLQELLSIAPFLDEAAARQSILDKKSSVALIIPENLTASAYSPDAQSELTLLYDPADSLSPAIVGSIVSQYINGYNGSRISAQVVTSQLTENGTRVDPALYSRVAQTYGTWVMQNFSGPSGDSALVKITSPSSSSTQTSMQTMTAQIMSGMIIFFVFYTGALIAQSIIREQDDLTLARLMTTPTPVSTLLGGKLIAAMLMISIQIAVLMLLSQLFFGFQWGNLLEVGSLCAALTFLAAGFGLFLMSFVKSMRQTGIVLGGMLTVLGMLGGLFTQGFQNLPKAFAFINLLTPHGWAMRGYNIALGAVNGNIWITIGILIAIGSVSLLVGIALFRRRFA